MLRNIKRNSHSSLFSMCTYNVVLELLFYLLFYMMYLIDIGLCFCFVYRAIVELVFYHLYIPIIYICNYSISI